VAQF